MNPLPVEIDIGGYQLYPYILSLIIVYAIGYQAIKRRLTKDGLDSAWVTKAKLPVFFAGIAGAVLIPNVLVGWRLWFPHPMYMLHLAFADDRLSTMGALITALPVAFYIKNRYCPKVASIRILDSSAPTLIACWALGRLLVSQLTGFGGGKETNAWYGISYHSSKQIPLPLIQFVEYLGIWAVLTFLRTRGARRIEGLQLSLLAVLWGLSEFLNQSYLVGDASQDIKPGLGRNVAGAVTLVGAVATTVLIRKYMLQSKPQSWYARLDRLTLSLAPKYWRMVVFLLVAGVSAAYGYHISDIWAPTPRQPSDLHTVNLYTSDANAPALLELTLELNSLYITPVIDIPAGRTVQWAVLITGTTSKTQTVDSYLLTPNEFDHYLPKEQDYDAHFAPGAVEHQQLITGSITGPTTGATSQAKAALSSLLYPSLTGPLSKMTPFELIVPGGDDFYESGHLMATLPNVGYAPLDDSSIGIRKDSVFGWSAPLENPTVVSWYRPHSPSTRAEFDGPLEGTNFNFISPSPTKTSATSVTWEGQGISAEFDAKDLDYADQQGRNDFIAGILLAVGASAFIAAIQESPKDRTKGPRDEMLGKEDGRVLRRRAEHRTSNSSKIRRIRRSARQKKIV